MHSMTGNTRLYGAVVITIAHFNIVEPARGLSGFVIGSAKTLAKKKLSSLRTFISTQK